MKYLIIVPFAVLAGVLAGSWGPREEIREMKRVAAEQKESAKNVRQDGIKAFTDLVRIPTEAKNPNRSKRKNKPLFAGAAKREHVAVTNRADVALAETNAVSREAVVAGNDDVRHEVSATDLRARIEEAQELWRVRVELARSNWKAKLKIAPENEERFNAVLDEMNNQLYDSLRSFSQLVAEKGDVTVELGLRLASDATAIMAETYEKIGACAPEEMRNVVSNLPMPDFIDPGVAEPLVEIQGAMEDFARSR